MIKDMLQFGESHSSHYRHVVQWDVWPNLGQKEVTFICYSFYLESTCLGGIVQEVLRFGKNLNNLPIFKLLHLSLMFLVI